MNRYTAENAMHCNETVRSRSIRGKTPKNQDAKPSREGWNTNLFPRKSLVSLHSKKLMPAPTARRVIYTRLGSPPLTTANYDFTADSSTVLQVTVQCSQMLFDLPSAPLLVTC